MWVRKDITCDYAFIRKHLINLTSKYASENIHEIDKLQSCS